MANFSDINLPSAPFLTLAQIAEFLQLSKPTVWRMAESGDMPAAQFRGIWRVSRPKFLDWLTQQEVATAEKIKEKHAVIAPKRPVGRPKKKGIAPAAK